MRALLPAAVLAALASCGAGDRSANDAQPANTGAAVATLTLTSDAFHDGQPIPAQFTCDGANRSPALSWSEPPRGTKSFALVVDDPDAPGGTFRHWGAYDIPPATRSIAGGGQIGAQAVNGMGKFGYGGPCPPRARGPHRYRFKLYALDSPTLGLPPGTKVEDLETQAQKHALARGELIGTYERK